MFTRFYGHDAAKFTSPAPLRDAGGEGHMSDGDS